MNTVLELCKPRDSVFDQTRRDVALNLTDLAANRINAHDFFAENYLTGGMKRLFRESFRRFAGHSAAGVKTYSVYGGRQNP